MTFSDGVARVNGDVSYAGGGVREDKQGAPRFELLFPLGVPYAEQLLTRCAVHMAKGAQKYTTYGECICGDSPEFKNPQRHWSRCPSLTAVRSGDRNWESFADEAALERAKAGAMRHMIQWLTEEDDGEDHAAALLFNVMVVEHVKRKIR